MMSAHAAPGSASSALHMHELLARQLALYTRLERLSAAQRDCIQREDTRPLLSLLTERQRLTAALTALSAELTPYRLRWDALKRELAPAPRAEIEGLLREVGVLLRRILDGDEADVRLLASRRDNTAGDLRGLHAAQRTLSAYAATAAASAGSLEGTEA